MPKTKEQLADEVAAIDELARENAGIQCPECYGVQITTRTSRFQAQPNGWQCEECGCQWSPPVKLKD